MKAYNKYILLFFIVFTGLFFEETINLYKSIVLSVNIVVLLVTLIAGLFGFIVAVIPFAIQLFNQDNANHKNDFLNKLMKKDKFNFFVKPMFNRFIKMLHIMLFLFMYAFFLNILQTINFKNFSFMYIELLKIPIYKFGIVVIFYGYIVLISEFFIMLRNIIRDLQTLVFNFFKSKENDMNEEVKK